MIDIGILLDVCGILYTEDQLIKLDKLLNDLIQKYISTYSSDSTPQQNSSNITAQKLIIKQEDVSENDGIESFVEVNLKEEPEVEDFKQKDFQTETSDDIYQNNFENSLPSSIAESEMYKEEYNVAEFKCFDCNKLFSDKFSLKKHVQSVHEGKKLYKCSSCDMRFVSKWSKKEHFRIVHEGQNPMQCKVCNEIMSSSKELRSHYRKAHQKSFQCSKCEKVFIFLKSLEKHERSHQRMEGLDIPHKFDKPKKCSYCEKEFESSDKFRRHVRTSHGEKTDFQCMKCGKFYDSDRNLRKHVTDYHSESIKCEECDKFYPSNNLLQKHKRAVHGVKNIKCPKCDFCASRQGSLNSHLRNVHDRPIKCNHCEGSFGDQTQLVNHMARFHAIIKNFKCEKCNDMFGSQKLLNSHLKRSHDTKRPLECPTCFKTFNVQKALDEHIEKEHEEKNCESCPYCGKQYKKLKVHLEMCNDRWVGSERPTYKCDTCNKTFTWKDSLRQHRKKYGCTNVPFQ